ncbi:hypothetical protein DIPPA_03354 [Diplonema papillatum]|nr:hypothetical protein DIPPA_03354 [Diplonema papillatum]
MATSVKPAAGAAVRSVSPGMEGLRTLSVSMQSDISEASDGGYADRGSPGARRTLGESFSRPPSEFRKYMSCSPLNAAGGAQGKSRSLRELHKTRTNSVIQSPVGRGLAEGRLPGTPSHPSTASEKSSDDGEPSPTHSFSSGVHSRAISPIACGHSLRQTQRRHSADTAAIADALAADDGCEVKLPDHIQQLLRRQTPVVTTPRVTRTPSGGTGTSSPHHPPQDLVQDLRDREVYARCVQRRLSADVPPPPQLGASKLQRSSFGGGGGGLPQPLDPHAAPAGGTSPGQSPQLGGSPDVRVAQFFSTSPVYKHRPATPRTTTTATA